MNKPLFTFIIIFTLSFSFGAQAADTVLSSLIPAFKNCQYASLDGKSGGLYEPFSDIASNFPGMKDSITPGKDGKPCVRVSGGTESLLKLLFTTAITIIIVLTVISISVAGIQYMTEQATGKIDGGAKKRLQNSFVALGLGLLSYTILYTINKQLVDFTFNPASIDISHSVDKGIADANAARLAGVYSSNITALENSLAPTLQVPYAPGYNPYSPLLPGVIPNPNEVSTPGNFPTYASAGSIHCAGALCTADQSTVFGYLDGNGTVGNFGDNGIGNSLWSDKVGCAFDTGNMVTMGVALPKSFWSSAHILTSDVKYIGIKMYVNGVFQKILPVVDDSQQNLDLTFATAKAYIDPTITNSNRLNTAGKKVTFEILKDYYKTTPKTGVLYTSNKSTFSNKIPCNI